MKWIARERPKIDRSSDIPPPMAVALAANFGSVQRWKDEFAAMGRAPSGGPGRVLLTFSPSAGALVNQWAADHTHALAGAVPILALDMDGHAHHLDDGARAAAYVDAFLSSIRWGRGTALLLRSAGRDAQFLLGGIDAWKASGGATEPKST